MVTRTSLPCLAVFLLEVLVLPRWEDDQAAVSGLEGVRYGIVAYANLARSLLYRH